MTGLLIYIVCNPDFVPSGASNTITLNGSQAITNPLTTNVFTASITSLPVSSVRISDSTGTLAHTSGIVGNGSEMQTQQMTDGNGQLVNFWVSWNGNSNLVVILDDQTFGDHR